MKQNHPRECGVDRAMLFRAMLSLESEEECAAFFADLCTEAELAEMSRRLLAAHLLCANLSYADVVEVTGLSTATISRVSRCLKNGSEGYIKALSRIGEVHE